MSTPVSGAKKLFWAALGLFVPAAIGLTAIDTGLRVPAAPNGIISFEFCGFSNNCALMLEQWGSQGQLLAMLSLGVDYLYLLLYPTLICTALLMLSAAFAGRLARFTRRVAWFALLASPADALENYFLIQVLLDNAAGSQGSTAAIFASIKFAVFGLSLLWLLIATMLRVSGQAQPDQNQP